MQDPAKEGGADLPPRRCWALTKRVRRCKNASGRSSYLPLCAQHEHVPRSIARGTVIGLVALVLGSIVFPEFWYWLKGQDAVKEEVAMSLQAQAGGVADRARSYVTQVLEPVAAGGGAAWWPVKAGLFDTFKKVQFRDRQTGWVLGTRSLISTSDGGKSWTRERFDETHLNDFEIVGSQAIWVVGNMGVILHTPGAATWIRQNVDTTDHLYGMDFLDDGVTGWAVGEHGLLLATTNGGNTWKLQNSGTDRNLIEVHAFDADTVWTGGASISLFTADGGTTWKTIGTDKTFTDVLFLDKAVGFAAENSTFYRTTDRGLTWRQHQLSGQNIAVRGFSFIDAQNGWLGNLYGQVFQTQDGGSTWSTQQTAVRRLNDVYFVDKSTGWAVGDDGVLLNTAPLSLPVDGKTPSEILSMLQASIARPYFEREGVLKRLEVFVDDHEALVLALRRLRDAEALPPVTVPAQD